MASAILYEKKYETKFMTTARGSAIIMPFCPPKARPIIISSSVIAVSRNAVLKVFPISFRGATYWMLRAQARCSSQIAHGAAALAPFCKIFRMIGLAENCEQVTEYKRVRAQVRKNEGRLPASPPSLEFSNIYLLPDISFAPVTGSA